VRPGRRHFAGDGARGVAALLVALAAAALTGRAVGAQAPSGPCQLIFENTPNTRLVSVKLPSGRYNSYIGGGVISHCPTQNLTLISDSAEYYGDQRLLYMIDHVHYIEPRADVHADRGTYYELDARLIADGHVDAKLPSGTTMTGPHADYLRALPGVRSEAQLTAIGRPHMNLVQRDSAGVPSPPVGVDANTIVSLNDSLVFANGKVDIDRTDVDAHGDSAYMDQGTEFMRLMRDPVIHGKRNRPFTLKGVQIDIFSHLHELQRVKSYAKADAVSQELHLVSDTIDLRMTNDKLERAYAWGPSRAHAITPDRDILSDSIDAMLPGQVLRQVRAIFKAYAQSTPDTVKVKSKEKDWMRGDTIIAYFDSTSPPPPPPARQAGSAPGDSTTEQSQPEVKTVVALRHAQAFYQMAPKDKCADRPALNYTRGRVITANLVDRQIHTIFVVDSAQGVYLEPIVEDTLTPVDTVVDKFGHKTTKARKQTRRKKGVCGDSTRLGVDSAGHLRRGDSTVVPGVADGFDRAPAPPGSRPTPSRTPADSDADSLDVPVAPTPRPKGTTPVGGHPAGAPPAGAPPAGAPPSGAPPSGAPPAATPPGAGR